MALGVCLRVALGVRPRVALGISPHVTLGVRPRVALGTRLAPSQSSPPWDASSARPTFLLRSLLEPGYPSLK